jgi:CubicO group peptidase (beta-lactamase class C family)
LEGRVAAVVEIGHGDRREGARGTILAASLDGGYFDSHGWGFGLSVVTRRADLAAVPGRFGWDGGLGASWYSDPREEMVGILLTQRAWISPSPPRVCLDFWTGAYQALDD